MAPAIKILIAEHDLHDIELIERELKTAKLNYISEIVQTEESYCRALEDFVPDIILSDYTFPSFNGPAAFKIKEKFTPDTPFILISGTIGEENSIELIKTGITDFVLKDKLFTLNTKLARALKQAKEAKEKKLADISLIESEARLVASQALANIGSWQTELSDMSVTWSQETFRIFDADPLAFSPTHQGFLGFIHPEDREKVKAAFESSLDNLILNTIEHRIITGKGIEKNVEERWRIINNDLGIPFRAIGTCQDITESKKNEIRIKASEERFRMLFEHNLAGFYQSRKDGRIINCNTAFATMLGYDSPGELKNINAKELYFSVSERNDFIERVNEMKKLRNHEGILKRKDGTTLSFLENSIEHTDPLTGEVYFDGLLIDISERKNAEKAIYAALKDKNIILESIDDAFFAVDRNFVVTYWNNRAEKTLGKLVSETVGNNLWEVFPESIDSDSYKNYTLALQTNKVIRFEDYYPPLEKWYEINAYPSANGLSVYFKDISDQKLSESKLRELNIHLRENAKELAVSNAELEQFAYVASHDLQEPLRMVTGFLGLLEKKYGNKIDDKGKTYISFAVNGAKHMRTILLDLLEFSKVGAADEKREDVDLNALLKEIRLLFKKETGENDPAIIFEPLPVIHSYRTPLLQVLQNLVSNALKYCRKDTPPKIHISVEDQSDVWLFTVRDNGIGISEEYFDKIFIIFQRLHNKEEFSGTGMGLAITKKIIENRGGKIWVTSTVGEGSSFYFTLPKGI